MLGALLNPETLSALAMFSKVKALGDNISAINSSPEDLGNIAREMGSELPADVATKMVALIPNYVTSVEQTLSQFVASGGLFRMLAGVMTGAQPQTVGRCKHCNDLVFF